MKEIGIRLRTLKEGLNLSQAKIAKLIGTSQVSINRYESGSALSAQRKPCVFTKNTARDLKI